MIRSEHVREELKALDKKIEEGKVTDADVVKAVTLVIKLLVDVRSNQVTVMKNKGIELRTKPNKEEDTKKE